MLDGENRLLVLDGHSQSVSVFGPSGQFLESFGRLGDGPEELRGAYGIALEPSGDLLVVGTGRQVKVFRRTASGWGYRETRPLPLAGGMACVTTSGRTIVAGADTRSDRNVLLHEVPSGVSTDLAQVMEVTRNRFVVVSTDPYPQIEVYAMDDERLAASSSISPRRPIASTSPPLG